MKTYSKPLFKTHEIRSEITILSGSNNGHHYGWDNPHNPHYPGNRDNGNSDDDDDAKQGLPFYGGE